MKSFNDIVAVYNLEGHKDLFIHNINDVFKSNNKDIRIFHELYITDYVHMRDVVFDDIKYIFKKCSSCKNEDDNNILFYDSYTYNNSNMLSSILMSNYINVKDYIQTHPYVGSEIYDGIIKYNNPKSVFIIKNHLYEWFIYANNVLSWLFEPIENNQYKLISAANFEVSDATI